MAKANGINQAEVIANMAVRGASHEAIAAYAATVGYVLPTDKANAATAPLPEWITSAKSSIGATVAKATTKAITTDGPKAGRDVRRVYSGPYDREPSKSGNPMVSIETVNSKGSAFVVSLPLDAFLAIYEHKLTPPAK